MKKIILFALIAALLPACAVQQNYYLKSNLNSVSIGQSKTELLKIFPGQPQKGGAPPMQIRAAQKSGDNLVEVGEVLMTDGVTPTVAYWFLFENGSLVQWGQPADWKEVKARYEISYNPTIGVSR